MNLTTLLTIYAGGTGSGPTAPCPQCGPHHEHYQEQDSRKHIDFDAWLTEHGQRLDEAAKMPGFDKFSVEHYESKSHREFTPKPREKERRQILLNDIKNKLVGTRRGWSSLTKAQSHKIIDIYNVRREKFGLLPTTPEEDELVKKTQELRESKPVEEEATYESVTPHYLQEAVSPGVRIAQYHNQLPTTVKTTGKTWTSRPHNDKGNFKQEASVTAPHEGRKTFVITHEGPQGGTTAFINQNERSKGAKDNHVMLHETNFDNYGNRWRTRSREFTAPKSAFRHIENRYGVKLS